MPDTQTDNNLTDVLEEGYVHTFIKFDPLNQPNIIGDLFIKFLNK